MKILIVDQFGKTTGRDTLALAELMNSNADVDVEVYLSYNTEIPENKKYTVKIIKGFKGAYEGNFINKGINYLKALKELKRYIYENSIDIVHLQWFSLPWIEWLYVGKLKKNHKIVITVHDVVPFDNRPFEIQSLDKIYSKADSLILHTKSSSDLFQKIYGAKTKRTVVSQNFCLKSDYVRIDKKLAKEHFKIPQEATVFLYYGTIRHSKGLKLLFEAIQKAHTMNEQVYLLAAGAFHKVNEEEYKRIAKKLSDDGYAIANFGFVPYEEEQWYFSAADVLCLPYLEVTQSGVAQIGLMYDLPLIATNIGEMSAVCRDDTNGILINHGDVDELTDAILKFANDKNFLSRTAIQSSVLSKTEFTLNVKADKIMEVYRDLLV